MRLWPIVVIASGCAEPVITMALKLPPSAQTTNVDLSCVGSIDVIARGTYRGVRPKSATDPGKPADDSTFCLDVAGLTSFDKIREVLRDQVSLALPASGLAGIEVFGSTGNCQHNAPSSPMFSGGALNSGDVLITVPVNPNVSCNKAMLRIRPVDLFALTASPTHACPPAIPDGAKTGLDTDVLQNTLLDGPILPYSGTTAPVKSGVVTIPAFASVNANGACPAFAFGDGGALTAGSCLHQGSSVCAQSDEIELPVVNGYTTDNLLGKSPVKSFTGLVVGAVWGIDAAGKKAPLVGATVEIDAKKGKVVYADYVSDPAVVLDLNASAIKSSGLFVLYTNGFVEVTMSAPGYTSEKVRVAPNGSSDSTLLVALRHQ